MDYKEKLKLAKEALDSGSYDKDTIEYIFPELKENEDKKIKEALIEMIHDTTGDSLWVDYNVHKEDALAWLEKQGEQKYTVEEVLIKAGLKPYKDGDQWCILLGDNIQEGICGFGNTVEDALYEFLKDLIAKQGEQKPVFEMKTPEESLGIDSDTYNKIVDECIYGDGEQKPADKAEPKFKQGEWIVWQDKCYKVKYNGCGYELVDQNGLSTSLEYGTVDENAHLWDIIQDAKDGDVLIDKSGNRECPFIFKETKQSDIKTNMLNPLTVLEYCGIGGAGFTKGSGWGDTANCIYYPATKEQRDLLFSKMKESDYKWDAEKKEVKKIEQKPTDEEIKTLLRTEYEKGRADAIAEMQKPVDCIDCTNSKGCINCEDGNMKETLVRKPAWSEEDENILDAITYTVKNSGYKHCIGVSNEMMITFIKSLKDRVQLKQEWSKEDESIALGIEQIVNCASLLNIAPDRLNKVRDWLKSLRPQNRWKPTELQMDVLLDEVNAWTKGCPKQKVLESLYNDLKKLMEE